MTMRPRGVDGQRRRPEEGLLRLEIGLEPEPQGLRIRQDVLPGRLGQRPVSGEGLKETAAAVEHLDPVIAQVGHVHVPVAVHGDAGGPVELAIAVAGAAELVDEAALGVELLHAVVAPVDDVHVANRVHGNAPRHVELSLAIAEAAPGREEDSVPGEALHAMVEGVGDVEAPIEIKCDARRPVQLSLSVSTLAPRSQEVAIGCDGGYAVCGLVGDVNVVLGVHGDRHRPLEGGLGGAHGAQVVVVPGQLPDGRGAWEPAQDVDIVVGAHCHVHRRVGDSPHSQRLQVWEARPQ